MKKGFTLVELIVVIGIIGILSGVLLVSFSGGTESARSAHCLTNMRNLATACQTYGMAVGRYPPAGSFEWLDMDESEGIRNTKKRYDERSGWISWNSRDAYGSKPQNHTASISWFTSCYEQDLDRREYALSHGALWKYLSRNKDVYVCPEHKRVAAKSKPNSKPPLWSYAMNSYFVWDSSKGTMAKVKYGIYNQREYGQLSKADKRLLFAEIPFTSTIADPELWTDSGSTVNDCTLQYSDDDGGEYIGFNHKATKKNYCAHVVFADAHVEKILLPSGGMGKNEANELTRLLCEGKDYVQRGKRFEESNK